MSQIPPPPPASPYPPPPQQFGAPPGPPGPPGPGVPPGQGGSGSTTKLLLVVAAVAVVAVGAYVVLGGGGGGGKGDGSPTATVGSFLDAVKARDCTKLVSLVTDQSLSAFHDAKTRPDAVTQCRKAGSDPLTGLDYDRAKLKVVSQDADSATVIVPTSLEGKTDTLTVPVLKQGGAWRIDVLHFQESADGIPKGG